MTAGDRQTLDHYEASVPFYTLAFDCSHSRHLDAFLDRLPSEANILELGCGTGRDAARMKERGFRVEATDGSAAMVAKANERHGVDARLMRFDQLAVCDTYDAVWAHACLMHCPLEELPGIINTIGQTLRKDGLHYASFKHGSDEFRDDRGRLNTRVSAGHLFKLYDNAGLEMIDLLPWKGKGADGVMREWLSVTARKP